MLRAVYPYEPCFDGCLHMREGDLFLKIEKMNEYWQLVAKHDGSIGCVPNDYVQEHKVI